MEKRRYNRVGVRNLFVDLSDGQRFFSGTVADISRTGILLEDVPKTLNENQHRLQLVVSGKGRNFRMVARPRWIEHLSVSKRVGLEILRIPVGWTEFVVNMEPPPAKEAEEIWI